MKTWLKVTLVTAPVTILAFLFGGGSPGAELVWGEMPADNPQPTGAQLPLLMVIGVFEGLSLGLALSFVLFGWPLVKRVTGPSKTGAVLMFASIAWMLGNWWMHDNLHMRNGMELWGLIAIEYGFHVTLIVAGAIAAFFFVRFVTTMPSRGPMTGAAAPMGSKAPAMK